MKKFFILAAAALSFAACSNNESDNQVQNPDNAIRLNASVGEITRAGSNLLETNFAANTKVKVQVTDKKTTDAAAVTYGAVDYTVGANGALSVTPIQYYPASGSEVKVYAYYPSTAADNTTFTVATDQNENAAYQASDLMYATLDPLVKNTTNQLTFNHVMSKITVTLTAGTGFTAAELNNAIVTLKNVKYKGTFAPADGTFTAANDTENITITTAAGTTAKSAIIVPQDVAGKKLAVTIAGKEMEYSIPASTNFEKGKNNTYSITVAKTGIQVSSSIANWGNGGNNDSQTASDKTLTY